MQGDNTLAFFIEDGSGNYTSVSTNLNYNQWYHVAGTFDAGSSLMELYVNGALVSQASTSIRPLGNLIPGDYPGVGIGNVNDNYNNFPFTGDIDEVALYNRALTAAEIQLLYSAGSQYVFMWTNAPIGTNLLTAVATDNDGLTKTSTPPVSIIIRGGQTMSVRITQPVPNAVFVAPAALAISATVSNAAYSIQRVDFYANGVLIGSDSRSSGNPYTYTWAGVPAMGSNYVLTATAVDVLNNTATSPGIPIHVAPPVQVYAGTNQVVVLTNSLAAVKLNGSVSGGYLTVTSLWSLVAGPANVAFVNPAGTNTAVSFTNAGSYLLRLVAGDVDTGSSASDTVIIYVENNLPPVVDAGPNRIIAPSNTVFLNGSVTDDGLPSPPSLSSWWSVISGPVTNGITFTNVYSPVTRGQQFHGAGRLHPAPDGHGRSGDQFQRHDGDRGRSEQPDLHLRRRFCRRRTGQRQL